MAAAAAQLVLDGDGDGAKEWPRGKKPAREKKRAREEDREFGRLRIFTHKGDQFGNC